MEAINRSIRDPSIGIILSGTAILPPMNFEQTKRTEANNGRISKKATRDRFGVLNEFIDCSMGELTRAEIATWFCLYRDTRNGTASTAQSDIARRANLSIRSVGKALKKLKSYGLVVIVFQGGLNRGPSRYRVHSLRNHGS